MAITNKTLLLDKLLAYQDEPLVHYFAAQENRSLEEVRVLFADLMRFFWLDAWRRERGKKTYFFGPLLVLDRLWHCFILHTRAYHRFCTELFGEYYHHDVEPLGQEHSLDQAELEDFLNDCFSVLGEDFVDRYFSSFYQN